jgi:antitoxin component HigA of HigAB toxin-antitoxin module
MCKEETPKIVRGFLKDTPDSDNWREVTAYRNANKVWLKKSARIAVKILQTFRENKMTQEQLAELMAVSLQQIQKILKGRENLTLETITKLEAALGIELGTIA